MHKLSDEELRAVILDVLRDLNLAREADHPLPVDSEAPLFGQDGTLDSMELVALAMDLEDAFAERGIDISLSDERIMSARESPFRSIASLIAFLKALIADKDES